MRREEFIDCWSEMFCCRYTMGADRGKQRSFYCKQRSAALHKHFRKVISLKIAARDRKPVERPPRAEGATETRVLIDLQRTQPFDDARGVIQSKVRR
jgi:hypothetical protein